MKTKFNLITGLIFSLITVTGGFGQEMLDAVVAVVGDKIILRSEVVQKVEDAAIRQNIARTSPSFELLKDQILEELVSQKILLIKAKEDTITIDDAKVDAELEKRMAAFIEQLGSKEKVEETFGLPFSQLKRKFRPELYDYMLVQEVRRQQIMGIQIYPQEVEHFFNAMKDSLPVQKEMVKLHHILIGIKASGESYNKALAKMQGIQKQLQEGTATFEDLAKQHSEDPGTADKGGRLGFISRGEIFQEFEDAAFALEPEGISDVVQTEVGLHLIKCNEIRGDRIDISHIFIKIAESQDDEKSAYDLALNIRDQVLAGAPFDSLAYLYSDDPNVNDSGGEMPWTPLDNLSIPAFIEAVSVLKKGEITMPFKTQFGYHIVQKEDEQPARPFSLEEDFEQLKMAALQNKQNNEFIAWIEKQKKDIYIELKRDLLK